MRDTDNHAADAILYAFRGHRAQREEAASAWFRLERLRNGKRAVVIYLPEWIAAARRASNRLKRMVIGLTLIGFSLGGFAVTFFIHYMEQRP